MPARATRRKNPVPAPIAPPAPPVLDDSGELGDANALIRSLTAEREGAEWSVKVYAVPNGMGRGATGRQQFLSECDLEDLPGLESGLALQYPGGGIFRVQIRANNELVKNVTLDIAPRPDYRAPRPAFLGGVDAPAAPAAAPPAEDRFLALLDRLAENQRASEERLTRALESIAARTAGGGLKEQIETFTAIQSLLPKGAQENGLEMFQKGMELAQKIFDAKNAGEGGGGGAGLMDFLIEAIKSPALKEIVAGAVAGAGQAAAGQAPAPIAPQIQQQPAAPIAGALDPANPALVAIVEQLCAQAAAGADPAAVAEMALGSIPENILIELESQPDIVAHLCRLFPQAAPHSVWLDRVIANMWEPEIMAAPSPAMAPNAPAPAANSPGSP